MAEIKSEVVLVSFDVLNRPLSPTQKKFKQLNVKVETQKKDLQEWEEVAEFARQQVNGKLVPLWDQLAQERAALIVVLHDAALKYKLTKIELAKLDHLVCELCEIVLSRNVNHRQENDNQESGDQESRIQEKNLKRIYAVHAGKDFDSLKKYNVASEPEPTDEEMYGDSSADTDLDNVDLDLADDSYDNDNFADHGDKEARDEKRASSHKHRQQQKRSNKKTKKQIEADAKQQQADALANQSLKQMYKRLAAILHPDREPVETEKVRKTHLMQRATDAYQNNDLIGLIQLQVEISQDGISNIVDLADDQLNLYNLNLIKYSKQLQQDIVSLQTMLGNMCRFNFYDRVMPKAVLKKLKDDISYLSQQHLMLQQQVRKLVDARAIKYFLKAFDA